MWTNKQYALASIAVIGITFALDWFIFNDAQTSPQSRTEAKTQLVKTLVNTSQQTQEIASQKSGSQQSNMKQLTLSNIHLPPPPMHIGNKETQVPKIEKISQSIGKPVQEQLVRQASLQLNNKVGSDTLQAAKGANLLASRAQVMQNAPTARAIKTQYEQLVSLDGTSLQLNFPNDLQETYRILNYMHDCIGIGIGALSNANQGSRSLTLLTKTAGDYSAIMRVASGVQTAKEKSLLQAYAPHQQLARLYPKWFDVGLSKKLALKIGQDALSQFSGTYQLHGNELILQNIKINTASINESWLLSKLMICRA